MHTINKSEKLQDARVKQKRIDEIATKIVTTQLDGGHILRVIGLSQFANR